MTPTQPRILILEEEPGAANILKVGLLKHLDCLVGLAASLEDAISILKDLPYDIAIINHVAGKDTMSHCLLL